MTDDDKKKRKVTIFGAGISGLTAAHELAIRGFEVEVIDPDIREEVHRLVLDRGIGGMARSQWACELEALGGMRNGEVAHALESSENFLLNDTLTWDAGQGTPTDVILARDMARRAASLIRRLTAGKGKKARLPDEFRICITVEDADDVEPPKKPLAVEDDPRVSYMKKLIGSELAAELRPLVAQIEVRGVPPQVIAVPGHPASSRWLYFQVPLLAVRAAEHGFRFFPSFYRHVFDTMRRTPIAYAGEYERTSASTLDNLLPSEGLGFARSGKQKSFFVPRRKVESKEEMRQYLQKILVDLEYDMADNNGYWLKLFEYMTSCTARRAAEYENISWNEFVDIDRFSTKCKEHIEFGPQMSAALRGSQSDTRTQGNITVQLVLDQSKPNARPDCTLKGPTSSAWLNHWHDFLRSQQVTFKRGELVDFEMKGGRLEPIVIRTRARAGDNKADEVRVPTDGDYVVLALSLPAAVSIAKGMQAKVPLLRKGDNDVARVISFAGDLTTLSDAVPPGPLQHLSGIQFYFGVPIGFWRGHTQYLDSEWGLTSIAQAQFWGRPRDQFNGYRGLLSVDIGIWDRDYDLSGVSKTAWECRPDEIAAGAWAQIEDHHNDAFEERYGAGRLIPKPFAYWIDSNLVVEADGKIRDKTPFLVNRIGAYTRRPGRLIDGQPLVDSTLPVRTKQVSFYELVADRYVFAGTYMKTYTRLTSMEAANESARHAVNAILQASKIACENCEIWDPEDNEVPDLMWMRDLDLRRFTDGLPHVLETFGRLGMIE